MDFTVWAALVAGAVATVVMTIMMKGASAAGMTEMPSFELMTGSMVSGERGKAMVAGAFIHYVMMGTVAFGLAYAFIFSLIGEADWWLGALIGVGHGLVVGLMAMPMMPSMHPRMGERVATVGDGSDIWIESPGAMGRNWGAATPVGVLAGHAVYGLVHALVYGALV
jgi:hypothetical protein